MPPRLMHRGGRATRGVGQSVNTSARGVTCGRGIQSGSSSSSTSSRERLPGGGGRRDVLNCERNVCIASLSSSSMSSLVWPFDESEKRRNGGGLTATNAFAASSAEEMATSAKPIVIIDNIKDPFATVVSIQFGDYLEGLIDTVAALKNLDLNIVRAKFTDTATKKNRFYVTDKKSNEKILDPERMEEIRLTILRNMASYHPESVEQLAVGAATGIAKPSLKYNRSPLGPRAQSRIATKISVQEDPSADSTRSILYLECADRPGLLVDIVKVLIDLSIEVVSAEVDTEGLVVKDAFFITYRGESLNSSMVTLVENALSYYLNLAEIEGEESY